MTDFSNGLFLGLALGMVTGFITGICLGVIWASKSKRGAYNG
jgi:hypothetical protein